MSRTFDVYGFEEADIQRAVETVEQLLGVRFEMRESDYWGGRYYCCRRGARRAFMIYENRQGEWYTADYKRYGVILLVNNVDDMEGIRRLLTSGRPEPVLLRTSTYPDEFSHDDVAHDD